MALNTAHIDMLLKGNPYTKPYFLGTFPSCAVEKLPKKKNYCFVTNVDHHNKGGSHWTAWHVRDGNLTFMDSFGRSPQHPSFPHDYKDIILKFKNYHFVNQKIQNVNSHACGYFAVHFLLCMCLGMDVKDFLSEYTRDTSKNDVIVMKIIESLIYTVVSFLKKRYQNLLKSNKTFHVFQ
jgi:hypothetical protein